jgi:hypothetical protein
MTTSPTRAIDPEIEMIDLLDAIGYLRNGSEFWTMVSKDFDIIAEPLSSLDFECHKPGESAFEILPGRIVQRLADQGYVKPVTMPAGNNANNQVLFIQLDPKGEQWYSQECPRWERRRLHHEPNVHCSDETNR